MVAKISHGGGMRGTLEYNQKKVDKEKGKVLECNRVMTPTDGRFKVADCVADFERFMPSHITTSKPVTHISLNPHPDDKLTDAQLADIGREYLDRLGYGSQPYMIFKHEDIDRQHIHIVTTRVRPDGSLVPDRFEKERSHRIVQQLETEFGLIPAKGRSQREAWQLKPIDAERGDLKRQVGNVIKPLSEMYRFRSISEYRALLSLYNIGFEKIEGDNKGHRYTGLVYSALDGDGNRVGQPLKSSLFGKKYGVAALEAMMLKSGEAVKAGNMVAGTKAIVSAALATARDGSEFRTALREKGIDTVLRRNDGGRLYGVTFIDHNSRTVLNGSALGKEFSANALSARFADFSTASRENLLTIPSSPSPAPNEQAIPAREVLQPSVPSPVWSVQTVPAPEASRSAGQSAPDDRNPATRTATPDPSPAEDKQAVPVREAAQPSVQSPVWSVQTASAPETSRPAGPSSPDDSIPVTGTATPDPSPTGDKQAIPARGAVQPSAPSPAAGDMRNAPTPVSSDTSRPAMPSAPLSGESGPATRTATPEPSPAGDERNAPVPTGEPSHPVGQYETGGEPSHTGSPSASAPSEDTQDVPTGEPSYTPAYTSPVDSGPAVNSATDDRSVKHGHGRGAPSGGGLLSLLTPEPGPPSDNGPSAPKRRKKKRQYGRQH